MSSRVSTQTRNELVAAVRQRYQAGNREDKTRILEEFVVLSGYHRKSAIRLLNGSTPHRAASTRTPKTVYDHAVREALQVLWEASDRVCGKRLKALIPTLIPALERHGHLQLDPLVRHKLLAISASSIDRLLREARNGSARRKAKRAPSVATRSVPVRTFADWSNPTPGYMEMDLVAHCGQAAVGSFVHTLTLTDIASGWTECIPLLVRDGTLVCESIDAQRDLLPFTLRGLDVDNGTEFINETLLSYCRNRDVELTRSRPYHKNDQAWIEQKNGSVVRRLVGYHRLEGVAATDALNQLYRAARLFVNCFQPSFQLKEKIRIGGRISKRYYPPRTPCARLLASDAIPETVKVQLQSISTELDPLALLDQIRDAQQQLASIADGHKPKNTSTRETDLDRFLASLTDAWRDGEVRPTHQSKPKPVRHWRTRKDPFETVWPQILDWLENEPDQTAKALFERLQKTHRGVFPDGQLRTLQRRVKAWRRQMAQRLVFTVDDAQSHRVPGAIAPSTEEVENPSSGNKVDEAVR